MDVDPDLGVGRHPNWSRLGLLHHGHGLTQVHVGRVELQRQRQRHMVLHPVHSHVDRLHGFRVAVRLARDQGVHDADVLQEVLHHHR